MIQDNTYLDPLHVCSYKLVNSMVQAGNVIGRRSCLLPDALFIHRGRIAAASSSNDIRWLNVVVYVSNVLIAGSNGVTSRTDVADIRLGRTRHGLNVSTGGIWRTGSCGIPCVHPKCLEDVYGGYTKTTDDYILNDFLGRLPSDDVLHPWHRTHSAASNSFERRSLAEYMTWTSRMIWETSMNGYCVSCDFVRCIHRHSTNQQLHSTGYPICQVVFYLCIFFGPCSGQHRLRSYGGHDFSLASFSDPPYSPDIGISACLISDWNVFALLFIEQFTRRFEPPQRYEPSLTTTPVSVSAILVPTGWSHEVWLPA